MDIKKKSSRCYYKSKEMQDSVAKKGKIWPNIKKIKIMIKEEKWKRAKKCRSAISLALVHQSVCKSSWSAGPCQCICLVSHR